MHLFTTSGKAIMPKLFSNRTINLGPSTQIPETSPRDMCTGDHFLNKIQVAQTLRLDR